MSWKTYRDLFVWQKGIILVNEVYELVNLFPQYEQFALSSQLRRAAVSVPSNIAEGQGRQTNKDFINFLYIANGSLYEIETQLIIAIHQQYITAKQAEPVLQECKEIGRMLNKLIESLR